MINLENTYNVHNHIREMAENHGFGYIKDYVIRGGKRYHFPIDVLLKYRSEFNMEFISNYVDFSNEYTLYLLKREGVIDNIDVKYLIANNIGKKDFSVSESMFKEFYELIRGDSENLKYYMKRIKFQKEFLFFHIDILDDEIIRFQKLGIEFIEENINRFNKKYINTILSMYHFDEEFVKKYHNPEESYPYEFFKNSNLTDEFLLTIDSPNNHITSDDDFMERYFIGGYKDKSKDKEEIKDYFSSFYQYQIYGYERVDCIDGDYGDDGKSLFIDDARYDCPDEIMEMLKDDGCIDISDKKEDYFVTEEYIQETIKEWDLKDESDKWDFVTEFVESYYKDWTIITYRYERQLKNICFSRKEALRLVKRYSTEYHRAYYQVDSFLNDDIAKLATYFRG